jgi:hypothetical protein
MKTEQLDTALYATTCLNGTNKALGAVQFFQRTFERRMSEIVR